MLLAPRGKPLLGSLERPRLSPLRLSALAVASALILGLAACGGEEETQDASEPAGEFPVEVLTSKFPNRQRLAETTDLVIGIENTGAETIPNLAVTIDTQGEGTSTGTGSTGAGSFSIRLDNPALANPNRPVWILENKYPRITGDPAPKGTSAGTVAQTNTFGFGELAPGEEREMVWRVTPIKAGTYTLDYEISAGLYGKAKAVTSDGSQPAGKFVVTISDKPPTATVTDSGKVETSN